LVFAVIKEIMIADIPKLMALVSEAFKLGDKWQVSETARDVPPGGNGDAKWCPRRDLTRNVL